MKILLCIAVLLAFWSTGFAQDKAIDQATFDSVYQRGAIAGDKLKGLSFRMTTTTEAKMGERPDLNYAMKMVYERDVAGSSHSVTESTIGTKSSKSELYAVGDTVYSRSGDGEWTQKARESGQRTSPPPAAQESPYEITEHSVDYKQSTEMYKDRTVQTYLKTENDKGVVKRNGLVYESNRTVKYWVNDQGTLIRAEYRTLSKSGQQINTVVVISDWDLDAEVRIAAPR